MIFNDLKKIHTSDELSYFPGDNDLRFRAFSPILKNLFENKVVYRERFICLVRLEEIQITPEFFSATAIPYLHFVKTGVFAPESPTKPWEFKSSWDWICMGNNSISVPYAGWTIWPEANRVKAVERLLLIEDYEEALLLTANQPDPE